MTPIRPPGEPVAGQLQRRLDAHHDEAGVDPSQLVDSRRGGGVAGHHQGLDAPPRQPFRRRQGKFTDLLPAAGAVGGVGGVPEIEKPLPRQLGAQMPQHADAAHAGVKYGDVILFLIHTNPRGVRVDSGQLWYRFAMILKNWSMKFSNAYRFYRRGGYKPPETFRWLSISDKYKALWIPSGCGRLIAAPTVATRQTPICRSLFDCPEGTPQLSAFHCQLKITSCRRSGRRRRPGRGRCRRAR